jgi:pimeloyl-ACP methyl ester carboxylesterase
MPVAALQQPSDAVAANGPVQLATTDYGGTGPSVVLMHGLGLTRGSLEQLAAHLTPWRVITLDLRGHGGSSTATWDFEQVGTDLDAVIRWYDLQHPYVAGHSLGGMVALQYALSGRPVAGAVNIDGWGPGLPERYLGEDPARITDYLEQVAHGHLPSRRAALVTGRSRQAREGTTRQVLRLLHRADVVDWHGQAPCSTLAVCATAPTSRAERWLIGRQYARRQDAHRRGLLRDLHSLAERSPLVQLVEVDASHALCASHPGPVAAAIQDFHARAGA